MSSYNVSVKYESEDGRALECRYSYTHTPGNISGPPESCYEDETDVGEATYYLDGVEIDQDDLPSDLYFIADEMYENGEDDKRFSYKATEDEGPDYEDY